MAVTKLLRIKERKSGDPSGGLKAALRYICNPDKATLVGGNAGSSPDHAYAVMKRNKDYWNKTGGSAGFHYVISFPPDCKVDARTAGLVAEDFTQELLGGRYYFTYAVHTDKDHMHVHIVFDSVAVDDGVKYHSPKGDWEKRIQPISDRVCQKYGLPPLEYGEARTSVNHGEWIRRKERRKEKHGGPDTRDNWETKKQQSEHPYIHSWFNLMRDDIDEAIMRSPSYGSFLRYMESLGYTVRDGKYLSLKPEGRERAVRTLRLGRGYSKEEIQERIEFVRSHPVDPEDFRRYGEMETVRRLLFLKKRKSGKWRMTPFQRSFYRSWRNTCLIRRPGPMARRGSRSAVLQLEELSDNLQFLIREDIRSEEDLRQKWKAAGIERKAVQSELSSVRTRIYRSGISRNVRRWKELKEKASRSPEEESELLQLGKKIERAMPIERAIAYEADLEAQQSRCLDQIRTLKSRERLLAGIDRQLMEMQQENISDPETGRTMESRKPGSREQTPKMDAQARQEENMKKEEEEVIR